MDDIDAMDAQERTNWFGCAWNNTLEPDDNQALSTSGDHNDN